jgi:hypothetical protein
MLLTGCQLNLFWSRKACVVTKLIEKAYILSFLSIIYASAELPAYADRKYYMLT